MAAKHEADSINERPVLATCNFSFSMTFHNSIQQDEGNMAFFFKYVTELN
jgi:hypothetical protein